MSTFLLHKIDVKAVLGKYLNHEYDNVQITKSTPTDNYDIKSEKTIYASELKYDLKVDLDICCNWCSEIASAGKNMDLGIPIKGWFSMNNNTYYYKIEGSFCSYECAYALLLLLKSRNPGMYSESENLLKRLFEHDHPGKKLRPANDFWLQRKYGGPLDHKEYVKNYYTPTNNRILIPLLNEYNLKNTN